MSGASSHVLDGYSVVLLDMNRTFMFGEDRFGPDEDYAGTYRALGGTLPGERVSALVAACYDRLGALYPDPAHHDRFPTVRETMRSLPGARGLGEDEVDRLERTFALHERGRVPDAYAAALHRLAASHRLAVVADIWADKGPWLDELRRAGVFDLFEAAVFSSEVGSVKPSPRPFLVAVEALGARREECVVVGDSARRDVGGAKAAGLSAVWIGQGDPPEDADWIVGDLLDLVPEA